MLVFALAGPGAAVMIWVNDVTAVLRNALVPAISLAVVIITSYLAVLEDLWHPAAQLALLIAATLGSVGAYRYVALETPGRHAGRVSESGP